MPPQKRRSYREEVPRPFKEIEKDAKPFSGMRGFRQELFARVKNDKPVFGDLNLDKDSHGSSKPDRYESD